MVGFADCGDIAVSLAAKVAGEPEEFQRSVLYIKSSISSRAEARLDNHIAGVDLLTAQVMGLRRRPAL